MVPNEGQLHGFAKREAAIKAGSAMTWTA